MIQDQKIVQSISRILQRSERQQDLQKLIGSFVDVGIIPQLNNTNNQIIYGRRGTGKTHILKVLIAKLTEENPDAIIVFIDARTLGSTSQFSDPEIEIKIRCISLFRDVLSEIHNALLERLVNFPPDKAEDAFDLLHELSLVVTEPIVKYVEEELHERSSGKSSDRITGEAGVSTSKGVSASISGKAASIVETEEETKFRIEREDKVEFPTLYKLLKSFLERVNSNLYIIFDEWSSLPVEIQPYLAEFFKRSFIPNPLVTVKIASLEYRSQFGIPDVSGNFLGFELGSDLSTSVEIDDYYVYDRNPEIITDVFSEMLFKHLKTELPDDYLEKEYRVKNGGELASRMFTAKSTFEELVRASEGVARDLINIYSTAFFDSQRKHRDNIEHKSVLEAARQWYEKDKAQNLDEELRHALKKIMDEVIGHRRARSFLLPRELEKNRIIQRLFDARVLHLINRGYADKDNPGQRYNIYTLDYGTYVDLKNTSKAPQLAFEDYDGSPDMVVPFDDKRSIRRIVLTEEHLT